MKEKTPRFRTRARLFNQLGEQLIRSESIALLELVKNAYDADASFCLIQMNNVESKEDGSDGLKSIKRRVNNA